MKKGIRQFRKCQICNDRVEELYIKGKFKGYYKRCSKHKFYPHNGTFYKGHKTNLGRIFERKKELSYRGLHSWVSKRLGKPRLCEKCGSSIEKMYDWANKSHLYKKDLNDWIRLCRSCHIQYDKYGR